MTITAKIIADSISENGTRITTFELEYPRFIHSEFMTHRAFSRNSASSRAIPASRIIEQVESSPAMPVHWGKNQSGMQAKEELKGVVKLAVKDNWLWAAKEMVSRVKIMSGAGLHKQTANRLLEPFQTMKVLVTATEYNNFWWLRDSSDAQPEIQKLAQAMKKAYDCSAPRLIKEGMWHLPYVETEEDLKNNTQTYFDEQGNEISLKQAIMISCSSSAQISYRRLDTSLEKAEDIYKKLVESEPVHASAMEHCATPIVSENNKTGKWEEGVTHQDRDGKLWSGNFQGWIQYRQLISNNVKKG